MTQAEDLLSRRRTVLRGSRLSYSRPFQPVRGEGCWLFDVSGRKYLDAYNNVPHVGHCHPRVIDALTAQASRLSSNTRYLDHLAVSYAERLIESMNDPLGAVVFTCTASEANDLAWRMASNFTGHRGVITTRNGYHGNTALLTAMDGSAASSGKADWWETVDAPQEAANEDSDEQAAYARQVDEAMRRLRISGHGTAAFFFDSYFCSDGIRVPRRGFLTAAFARVREAGGLIVADEVQTGLGRCGSHMWAFQRLAVRPDIVVLGKSLGNGYPIGAVIARQDLVDAFYSTQRYFNTCAGSQVSAAVGSAVLDVIRDERLLDNAQEVGALMKRALESLLSRHPSIKSVRGEGFLLGLELTSPEGANESPGVFASKVIDDLLGEGVVAGLTGPDRNARTVLKIRPPMVFDEDAAHVLIEAIDAVLTRAER